LGALSDDAVSRKRVVIQPSRPLAFNPREVWEYRELLFFLVWREVRVRYKQTALGIGWVLIQPLIAMVIFSVIFGQFAKLPSEGLPYPLFVLTGLLPWQLFAGGLTRTAGSLVRDANLLTKIYFPRLLIPISAALAGLVDFVLSLVLLGIMLVYYGVRPGWQLLTIPTFGIWLAALNVRYRDVQVALPFLVQIWFFVSPVAYSATLVSSGISRLVYGLNPMASVIQGFRWSLVGGVGPGLQLLGATSLILAVLVGGLIYFRAAEKTFADVI